LNFLFFAFESVLFSSVLEVFFAFLAARFPSDGAEVVLYFFSFIRFETFDYLLSLQ